MILFAAAALLLTQAKPVEWKVATFPGGFTVDTPSSPLRLPRETSGASPLVTDSWMIDHGNSGVFLVRMSWLKTKDDKAPPHLVLAQASNELATSERAVIRSQKDLVLRGWPGIEAECTDKYGKTIRFRAYMVNGKLFEALAHHGSPRPDRSGSTRFLYSMNIPKSAGIGPQKAAGPEFAMYSLGGISVRFPEKPEKTAQSVGSDSQMGAVTRHQAAYGNRVYLCVVLDIPDELLDETQGHEQEVLETVNSKMFEGAHAKGQKDTHYQFGKHDVLSSSGSIDANFGMRMDSFFTGQRVYCLLAVTPRVLQQSDEVKSFFTSMKLD